LGGVKEDPKAMDDSKKLLENPVIFEPTWGVWAAGSGIFADGDPIASTGQPGFDYDTASAFVGLDYRVLPELAVGLVGSYANTDATVDGLGSSLDVDSYAVGAYANYLNGGWHAHGLFSYGWNDYDSNRNIRLPGFNQSATATPHGEQYTVRGSGGYDFTPVDGLRIGPTAALQYFNLDVDSFTETGAGPANLAVAKQSTDSLRSQLGFQGSYTWELGPQAVLLPAFHASWVHEFLDDSRGITAQFTNLGAGSFAFATSDPERDFAFLGASLGALVWERYTFWVGYDAQAGQDNFFAQQVSGGVRVDF